MKCIVGGNAATGEILFHHIGRHEINCKLILGIVASEMCDLVNWTGDFEHEAVELIKKKQNLQGKYSSAFSYSCVVVNYLLEER